MEQNQQITPVPSTPLTMQVRRILILTALLLTACQMQPEDAHYIPPGWSEPQLAYPKAAYFPAGVTGYRQGPGQFATNGDFRIDGNLHKLLGPPAGGGSRSADNNSVVSLGTAGGSVTVRFDPPIQNHPDNIGGYDFIVFGNAYWSGSAGLHRPWQEPATVWVMKDENRNGSPDDSWYLIQGSHLPPQSILRNLEYREDDGEEPLQAEEIPLSWWPEEYADDGTIPFSGILLLPDALYTSAEPCSGYADVTPVLRLGDLSGAGGELDENSLEDPEDYPGIDPAYFYTVPDTPGDTTIDAGSGGGDAIDITWAVDPVHFTGVELDEVSWIRIVSASTLTGITGEYSCEIDAVTRVRRQ